ncbi:hypothetical protein [Mycobacteroides abscessus]|uniref:hypothetical protein n=1 Tax=Mycobacteroides abscessus TaxID=36809 RepID=UPI0009A89AD4|nr:hypothetical protein [Mycobacteroides abscessus]SKO14810.1 Uncharacterised protein [Mycobacteroides abscessus subsp. bolletii]SKX37606.1 Uncharacterised protein [Mycobacteroides abscessus subsp. bolletii]
MTAPDQQQFLPGDRVRLRSGAAATIERVLKSTVVVREDDGRILQTGQRHLDPWISGNPA